jgi:predicted lipoprotein with Yx(FWY)xxD motif
MGLRTKCADVRPLLGVYLTGAITPADRPVVLRHLASCEWCREELTGLAGLPGLLRRPSVRDAAGATLLEEVPLSRLLSGMAMRRRRRRWVAAAAAVVLAAGTATGWALSSGAARPVATSSVNVLLPETVGDVTVLADTEGYTLYWFASDTAGKSNCNGACARSWPPVLAPAAASAGVPGTLGTIRRSDGSLQVTYNGHPLYTAAVDQVPGLAKGNDVRASGGLWYEVRLAGAAPGASPSGSYGYLTGAWR